MKFNMPVGHLRQNIHKTLSTIREWGQGDGRRLVRVGGDNTDGGRLTCFGSRHGIFKFIEGRQNIHTVCSLAVSAAQFQSQHQ